MRLLMLIGLIIGLASCRPTDARDWFVNNATGSDELDGAKAAGASGAGPLKTINRALCLAKPGDRVVIANTGMPYREQISIAGPRLHGTPNHPLVITSDGAVLDGTVEAATGAWRHVEGDVFAMRPRRLAYQQLFSEGKPLDRVLLASSANAGKLLEPLQWSLAGGAILFCTEESRLPLAYDLRHAGLQTGVTLYNTHNVVVEGLVIQGFQQDGVNAHELVKECVLRNLDCRANGRSGISICGTSRVVAEACNCYDNGRAQVRTEGFATLDLRGCDINRQGSTPAYESRSGRLTIDGEPPED